MHRRKDRDQFKTMKGYNSKEPTPNFGAIFDLCHPCYKLFTFVHSLHKKLHFFVQNGLAFILVLRQLLPTKILSIDQAVAGAGAGAGWKKSANQNASLMIGFRSFETREGCGCCWPYKVLKPVVSSLVSCPIGVIQIIMIHGKMIQLLDESW